MFRNDYGEIACKEVLSDLAKYNGKTFVGYGLDEHCKKAEGLIKKTFKLNKEAQVHFVEGGTQANLIVISYFLKPSEAVICCNTGHINTHESGAVDGNGIKIITTQNVNGKILPCDIENELIKLDSEHTVKAKMVYISDSTENGSVYTLSELKALRKVCDKHHMLLFIDGARLGAALTCEGCDVKKEDISKLADVFYIGGTKNGALFGEAICINKKVDREDFRRHIKSKGGMLAKGYILGIQFETLFRSPLYFNLAKKGNAFAGRIRKELKKKNVEIVGNSLTNQVFIRLPKKKAEQLIKKYGLEIFGYEKNYLIIRIVTNYMTRTKEVNDLINEF